MDKMAAIPRAFSQRNKNSLEIERDNFERNQFQSIIKAVNPTECPLKEKHVRVLIMGTFHENNAVLFWNLAKRMDLQGNQITCWKFCHVLHKLLRDGHPRTLRDSKNHIQLIQNIGTLWNHLTEGYGSLIYNYAILLVQKMKFHLKYSQFPGNMEINDELMHKICEKDVNKYYELCLDMLDYLEAILKLQKQVFASLDMSRSNSMTSIGQCRLAPLIICIQDSCPLYDYIVKLLFDLHSSLESDLLSGHRDRFLGQYKRLKKFYETSSNLQYFKNLIKLPKLPERPPNFLIASEISDHKTPVAIVPESPPENDQKEGILVDTSDVMIDDPPPPAPFHAETKNSPMTLNQDLILESMQKKIEDTEAELELNKRESEMIVESQNNRIRDLEQEINELKLIASQTYQENENLKDLAMSQTSDNDEKEYMKEQLRQCEKNNKQQIEKFQKLMELHNSLKEKHADLLRQDKNLRLQLSETAKVKENLVQNSSSTANELAAKSEILDKLRNEVELLKLEKESFSGQIQNEKLNIERFQSEIEQKRNEMELLHSEINTLKKDVDKFKQESFKEKTQCEKLQHIIDGQKVDNDNLKKDIEIEKINYFTNIIACSKAIINESLSITNGEAISSCTASAEFLISVIEPTLLNIKTIKTLIDNQQENNERNRLNLIEYYINFAHSIANIVIETKCTSNTSPIDQAQQLMQSSKNCLTNSTKLLDFQLNHDNKNSIDCCCLVEHDLKTLLELAHQLVPKLEDVRAEEVVELLNQEMADMSTQIEQAAKKIQEIMNAARSKQKGIELEVNESVLASCTDLMLAIKILIEQAKCLQDEIVEQGRGSLSAKDFYKKNNRWTEGLLSGAKLIGIAANALVDSADKVVEGKAKLENLIVCSQEIAASTMQLVVASKVKAANNSKTLVKLSGASKDVKQATAKVVATAQSGSERIVEDRLLDYSKLSLGQAKRYEMNSKIKVLELEKALETERKHLSELKKRHYQLGGENEGWEEVDIENINREISSHN